VMERLLPKLQLVSLTANEVLVGIERATGHGIVGGSIYGFMLTERARKISAEKIFTYNRKHFIRAAPDLETIILEP